MRIPLVDLTAQYRAIRGEIDAAIAAVVESTSFVGGRFVAGFEESFARFSGAEHAVGCGNGTDALCLALEALGISDGDEVLMPSHTFFATPEAVLRIGAVPVFADLEAGGFNLDPATLPGLITERTRAIVPVHLYGQPCDMDPILEIAEHRGLKVVEDCAQAHGARYRGRPVGTLGDAGCFSFYPGKNLGAYGDAGAVITGDAELARRVAMLRDHGRKGKYEHEAVGYNSRLDALQASVLSAKLPHLAAWNEARRRAAAQYDRLLAELPVATPGRHPDSVPVYHLYVVRLGARDAVLDHLKAHGIGAGIHYPIPCHLQPALLRADGGPAVRLPATESVAGEILSLPLFPEITDRQIRQVVDRLAEALERHAAPETMEATP